MKMTEEEKTRKMEIDGIERDLVNLRKELPNYKLKREHDGKLLKRWKRKVELINELNPIVIKGIKRLNPDVEFETYEEFIKIKRELQQLDHESTVDKMNMDIKNQEETLQKIDQEIATITERIPEQEGRLKALRGE